MTDDAQHFVSYNMNDTLHREFVNWMLYSQMHIVRVSEFARAHYWFTSPYGQTVRAPSLKIVFTADNYYYEPARLTIMLVGDLTHTWWMKEQAEWLQGRKQQ